LGKEHHTLESFSGAYVRLIDYGGLPRLRAAARDWPERLHCERLHRLLDAWLEVSPARIVNRSGPMGSNFSKPKQLQRIAKQGFEVPETIITNDPELATDFINKHQRVIYKSISSNRSIVRLVEQEDLRRLEQILWCPTQFQVWIEGVDVRVHTVGSTVYACRIDSDAVDYRYARQQGHHAEFCEIELPEGLAQRCLDLAHAFGLLFSGIDLRLTPDSRTFCLEVNPSPAFSYYEQLTGQPISRSLAHFLSTT
jgi:glutathione synthase/RimK-type ligase-like ATP-grasp enzyme